LHPVADDGSAKREPYMDAERYEETVRRIAHRNGYRMMQRRNGQYWLIAHTPIKLGGNRRAVPLGIRVILKKGRFRGPFFDYPFVSRLSRRSVS
jgi:hypothetical protein